eukprot:6474919-Amphidinium_carterae.2
MAMNRNPEEVAFSEGQAHAGWVRNMSAGRSRVLAGFELAKSLQLDTLGVTDAAEMKERLRALSVPPAGEKVLSALKLEEVVFLAMTIHWSAGKTRKLAKTVGFGSHTIDFSTMSKQSIANRLQIELGALSGVICLACYVAVLDPSREELEELEAADVDSYNMLMQSGGRFPPTAQAFPYSGRPMTGTQFLNGVGAGQNVAQGRIGRSPAQTSAFDLTSSIGSAPSV